MDNSVYNYNKIILIEYMIAFCFLTYNDIIRYDIWNNFFKDIDKNEYIVFIHPKIKNICLNIINTYEFNYNIIKDTINTTSKTDISIVRATIHLLKEAFLFKEDITHFVFLTQSCIPLYSFNITNSIIKNFPSSVLSVFNNNKVERYIDLTVHIKKILLKNNFRKQQPNMILVRDDVSFFINNDYTQYFRNMECPDEHYFINLFIIFRKKFIKQQINFCNPILERTQAIEFNYISKKMLEQIKGAGFLFMRKIKKNTIFEENILDIKF